MIESFVLAWHVVRRHWLVYRKDLLANTAPTLTDPLFMMVAMGIGLSPHMGDVDGRSYPAFLAPGLAASAAFFTAFFETSYGGYFRLNFEGVYKAMMTTPIGPKEIIWGEFIWVGLKGFFMSLIVGSVFVPFGLVSVESLPAMALVGMVIAVGCGALGLISTTLVRNINQFQTVYAFIFSPLFFFSGILFPISLERSPSLFYIVQISPFYQGVCLMQSVVWKDFSFDKNMINIVWILGTSIPLVWWAIHRFRGKLRT